MMRAAKQDANHKELRDEARRMNVGWFDCFQLKKFCDAFIVYEGVTVAVEVKDGSKAPSQRKLTEGEQEFSDKWSSYGGKYAVIESKADLQGLIENIQHYRKLNNNH